MSEKRRLSGRRRRGSNGLSLLPSQDNFCAQIPDGIPEEERALILIRKCYVRTLHQLRMEHDVPDDVLRALTVDGVDAFQNLDIDDILMKILRVVNGDVAVSVTEEDAENYHEELRGLATESKAWEELLQSEFDFRVDLPPSVPDPADVAKMRNHYKMLADNCARIDQAGQLRMICCMAAAAPKTVHKSAGVGAATSMPSARDILGACSRKPR